MGMETDLIFNRGIDLPGFAAYPLMESAKGIELLSEYYQAHINLARNANVGAILDSTTWIANRDRGAEINQSPQSLKKLNIEAIELIACIKQRNLDVPILLCADIGPRGDGYSPSTFMTCDEAESYHTEQIEILSQTDADFICGATLCYPEEAIGMVRNATKFGMPIVISFTVETDGCLPTGMSLSEAILMVDQETDYGVSYFMVNCAHPKHFIDVLNQEPWIQRLRGIIVNASECSHAELDEAEALDDGNPVELGKLVGEIQRQQTHFTVFGGCCGTDSRHMQNILEQVKLARYQ